MMVISNLRRIGPQGRRGLSEPGCFHGNLRTRDNQWVGYLFSETSRDVFDGIDHQLFSLLVSDIFMCVYIYIYIDCIEIYFWLKMKLVAFCRMDPDLLKTKGSNLICIHQEVNCSDVNGTF